MFARKCERILKLVYGTALRFSCLSRWHRDYELVFVGYPASTLSKSPVGNEHSVKVQIRPFQ